MNDSKVIVIGGRGSSKLPFLIKERLKWIEITLLDKKQHGDYRKFEKRNKRKNYK